MIEINNLTKSFNNKRAVDKVSFTVNEGDTFVLIGPSGCGKTTTLKMINRLIEPDSGIIKIDGKDNIHSDPIKLRRKIGYVIQENNLFPHYTVKENIEAVPKLLKFSRQKIDELIPEVMDLVELPSDGFLKKYPDELSGGQQQRVAIARAIIAKPPLLLMDEPFSALDPLTRTSVRASFKTLMEKLNTTTIIVTHDISEAIFLADDICLLNEGRAEQVGKPSDLVFKPENDFVKSFFNNDRFDLEMHVVSIQDLLEYVDSSETKEKEFVSVSSKDSLHSVVNKLAEEGKSCIQFEDDSGKKHNIDQEALLEGFYRFRKLQRSA